MLHTDADHRGGGTGDGVVKWRGKMLTVYPLTLISTLLACAHRVPGAVLPHIWGKIGFLLGCVTQVRQQRVRCVVVADDAYLLTRQGRGGQGKLPSTCFEQSQNSYIMGVCRLSLHNTYPTQIFVLVLAEPNILLLWGGFSWETEESRPSMDVCLFLDFWC